MAWINLNKTSGTGNGTFTVSANAYYGRDLRSSSVTVKAGSINRTVTVNLAAVTSGSISGTPFMAQSSKSITGTTLTTNSSNPGTLAVSVSDGINITAGKVYILIKTNYKYLKFAWTSNTLDSTSPYDLDYNNNNYVEDSAPAYIYRTNASSNSITGLISDDKTYSSFDLYTNGGIKQSEGYLTFFIPATINGTISGEDAVYRTFTITLSDDNTFSSGVNFYGKLTKVGATPSVTVCSKSDGTYTSSIASGTYVINADGTIPSGKTNTVYIHSNAAWTVSVTNDD